MTASAEISTERGTGSEPERVVMLHAQDLFCVRDDRILFQSLNFDVRGGISCKSKAVTVVVRLLCSVYFAVLIKAMKVLSTGIKNVSRNKQNRFMAHYFLLDTE